MVGVRFSRIAEAQSEELANALVGRLMESPRTLAYREIDGESLRQEFREFFQGLTGWLLYRGQAEIERSYLQHGKKRAGQRVPMEQCVNAMLACRDQLVDHLRRAAIQGEISELFGELEFVVAVNQFFDDAIFFSMQGHKKHESETRQVG